VDFDSLDYESPEPPNRAEDEISDAIKLSIEHGSGLKMDIVRTATLATRTSRRRVLAVLEKFTGDDPTIHRWDFTVHERGAKVYAVLPASLEPDPPV
jgi:hypothetical protein